MSTKFPPPQPEIILLEILDAALGPFLPSNQSLGVRLSFNDQRFPLIGVHRGSFLSIPPVRPHTFVDYRHRM